MRSYLANNENTQRCPNDPALGQATGQQKRAGAAEEGVDLVSVLGQGRFEAGERLVEAAEAYEALAEAYEALAEAGMGLGEMGLGRECPAVALGRRLVVAEQVDGEPEVSERRRKIRPDGGGAAEAGRRRLGLAPVPEGGAEVVEKLRREGVARDRLTVVLNRLLAPAQGLEHEAEVGGGPGVAGVERECRPVVLDRILAASGVAQAVGQVVAQLGRLRAAPHPVQHDLDGRLVIALGAQGHAQVGDGVGVVGPRRERRPVGRDRRFEVPRAVRRERVREKARGTRLIRRWLDRHGATLVALKSSCGTMLAASRRLIHEFIKRIHMRKLHLLSALFLSGLMITGGAGLARERDRVAGDFQRADENGDGRLSREEWNRRGNFDRLDADGDGYLTLGEVRALYEGHAETSYDWPPPGLARPAAEFDPGAAADLVEADALDRETICAIRRGRSCEPKAAVERGLFETGLGPVFPEHAVCHGIDDTFALDYTFKRGREAYHGGIDLPARWGTPMIAVAAGTVVGVFMGEKSPRGIEIVLRHAPEDTGLPVWIYTGYAHLDRMPDLEVGQRVRLGEVIGPTGNSGVGGKKHQEKTNRRPAIHFSAFSSETGKYAIHRSVIVPVDGRWTDPIALYRQTPPLDSRALEALPEGEKGVSIPVMFDDGAVYPAGTRFVWPYMCARG